MRTNMECLKTFNNLAMGWRSVLSLLGDDIVTNTLMKGQSEIAYLPKFANMMLIVMVIVITEILYTILIFDCFENQ